MGTLTMTSETMSAAENSLVSAGADAMLCDFSRSFVRWSFDSTRKKLLTVSQPPPTTLNHVRIPLECVATVNVGGKTDQFGLTASCKTEQVFVEKQVWMNPNADMCGVMGAEHFLIIKRWDRANKNVMLHPPSLGPQPERHCVDPAQAFTAHAMTIKRRRGRRLDSIDEIIDVLRGDGETVCRTRYTVRGAEVLIEYPVKTINFSERHRYYQVDTGPVLFFGDPTGPQVIESCHLAYIAHLGGDWAEFLVSRPTRLENYPVAVHHFSETRHVSAESSIWAVEG